MAFHDDRTASNDDANPPEPVAAQGGRADYTSPSALNDWTKGLGRRLSPSNTVAAIILQHALVKGEAIVGVMKFPPHPWEPVALLALNYSTQICVDVVAEGRDFWQPYRANLPKPRDMDEAEIKQANESKALVMSSMNAFLEYNDKRLSKSSLFAIRRMQMSAEKDAGAVIVMRVPQDRSEPIDFRFYPFETNVSYINEVIE